jgi:ubiquinone/menaquinone biosynthesis C-methylase UbiE
VKEEIFLRLKQEREFHDAWARDISSAALAPGRSYTCPSTPEVTHGIDSLGDVRDKRILALGAGSGELSVFLAQKGAEVVVADISYYMCAVTMELARTHRVSDRVRVVTTAAEFMALPSAFFDLVFAENVLHHLDLDRALPEICRVLKENGKSVLIEPLGHNPILNLFRCLSPGIRTESEQPMRMRDIRKTAGFFSRCRHREFHLTTLMLYVWFYAVERSDPNKVRYWEKIVCEAERYRRPFEFLYAIDKILLTVFPFLKKHCRMTVVECWK